jgi:hypothetical protein
MCGFLSRTFCSFGPRRRFDKALSPPVKSPRFIPLPDPISEEQVSIDLSWSADPRTSQTIERQTKLMGYTPKEYLRQALAAVIAGNEEAIGELACIEFDCPREHRARLKALPSEPGWAGLLKSAYLKEH